MSDFIAVIQKILAHKEAIFNCVAYLVLAASVIVKITPTLKDDNRLKSFIKFIGKYIALDKYGPNKPAPSA